METDTPKANKAILDYVIDDIARCLLPKIQVYFDSPEGQAAFEAWKQERK